MSGNARGFTLVEVLVAVVVLTVGLLALAGSSGAVTRMIGRGRQATFASQVAEEKLEQLRALAASTAPPCVATASDGFASSTSPIVRSGITLSWEIEAPQAGQRKIRAIARYTTRQGTHIDTLTTTVACF